MSFEPNGYLASDERVRAFVRVTDDERDPAEALLVPVTIQIGSVPLGVGGECTVKGTFIVGCATTGQIASNGQAEMWHHSAQQSPVITSLPLPYQHQATPRARSVLLSPCTELVNSHLAARVPRTFESPARVTLLQAAEANMRCGFHEYLRCRLSPRFTAPPMGLVERSAELIKVSKPFLTPEILHVVPLMSTETKSRLLEALLSLGVGFICDLEVVVAKNFGMIACFTDFNVSGIRHDGYRARFNEIGGVGASSVGDAAKMTARTLFTSFVNQMWSPNSRCYEALYGGPSDQSSRFTLSTSIYQLFRSCAAVVLGTDVDEDMLRKIRGRMPGPLWRVYLDITPRLARLYSAVMAYEPHLRDTRHVIQMLYEDDAAYTACSVARLIECAFNRERDIAQSEHGQEVTQYQQAPQRRLTLSELGLIVEEDETTQSEVRQEVEQALAKVHALAVDVAQKNAMSTRLYRKLHQEVESSHRSIDKDRFVPQYDLRDLLLAEREQAQFDLPPCRFGQAETKRTSLTPGTNKSEFQGTFGRRKPAASPGAFKSQEGDCEANEAVSVSTKATPSTSSFVDKNVWSPPSFSFCSPARMASVSTRDDSGPFEEELMRSHVSQIRGPAMTLFDPTGSDAHIVGAEESTAATDDGVGGHASGGRTNVLEFDIDTDIGEESDPQTPIFKPPARKRKAPSNHVATEVLSKRYKTSDPEASEPPARPFEPRSETSSPFGGYASSFAEMAVDDADDDEKATELYGRNNNNPGQDRISAHLLITRMNPRNLSGEEDEAPLSRGSFSGRKNAPVKIENTGSGGDKFTRSHRQPPNSGLDEPAATHTLLITPSRHKGMHDCLSQCILTLKVSLNVGPAKSAALSETVAELLSRDTVKSALNKQNIEVNDWPDLATAFLLCSAFSRFSGRVARNIIRGFQWGKERKVIVDLYDAFNQPCGEKPGIGSLTLVDELASGSSSSSSE